MEQIITIRSATGRDYAAVTTLLIKENLPVGDIDHELSHFMVAEVGNTIEGVAGLELYGKNALLRSVAVSKEQRNHGLAAQLVNHLFTYAGERGIENIYLLTNTAAQYFERKGFVKISREEVPGKVRQSKEFNGLCPSSAVAMVKSV